MESDRANSVRPTAQYVYEPHRGAVKGANRISNRRYKNTNRFFVAK